ncbi:MAG: uracil-DNA glycosylase family protein [Alphaproteobacteria bacterium]
MQKTQKLEILQWYYKMGVNDITDHQPRDYNVKIEKEELLPLNKTNITEQILFDQESVISNSMNSKEIVLYSKELAEKCKTVDELREALMKFDGCLLKKTATNTVFSDGNPKAKIMIIGEAPGANEDIQGIPFCGDSGKLLDNMLSFIGLNRKDNLYVTNAIFWRPPGNRKPTPNEIATCLPWVERHIALFQPKFIILAGSTSVSAILGMNEAMSKIRNKFYDYQNSYSENPIPTAVIFHPSYLLRQPSQKKLAWLDLLKIKQYLQKNNIL